MFCVGTQSGQTGTGGDCVGQYGDEFPETQGVVGIRTVGFNASRTGLYGVNDTA